MSTLMTTESSCGQSTTLNSNSALPSTWDVGPVRCDGDDRPAPVGSPRESECRGYRTVGSEAIVSVAAIHLPGTYEVRERCPLRSSFAGDVPDFSNSPLLPPSLVGLHRWVIGFPDSVSQRLISDTFASGGQTSLTNVCPLVCLVTISERRGVFSPRRSEKELVARFLRGRFDAT